MENEVNHILMLDDFTTVDHNPLLLQTKVAVN